MAAETLPAEPEYPEDAFLPDFDDLLNARMSEMDLWMKRIELSYKPHYLHPKLGKKI